MKEQLRSSFIAHWKHYFPGVALPVAIFYSDSPQNAEPVKKSGAHRCIIADIVRVFRGKALAFSSENIGCEGGKRYCGFSDKLRPEFEYFLSYGIEGKVEGERYKKDPGTVSELMKNTPTRQAPARWLIVKPFDQLTAEDEPEVIVFLAHPDVLAGLFTLANYDRTDLFGVKSPFCAGCGSIVQYPLLENTKGNPDCILGMFDSSARAYVKEGLLSFAIPMKRFETLVGYMDESFLITGTWKVMSRRIGKASTKEVQE
jgi:uncharacterized protein (DUF169 family)